MPSGNEPDAGFDRGEGTAILDVTGHGVEVVGVDDMREALAEVHGPVVGAPGDAVRAAHALGHAHRLPVPTKPIQIADRMVPVDVAHGAGPMAPLTVGLAVVETIASHLRLDIGNRFEAAGRLVEEREAAAQREQHAAARARGHRRHDVRACVHRVRSIRRIEDVQLLADDVDPVEALGARVPHGSLADLRVGAEDHRDFGRGRPNFVRTSGAIHRGARLDHFKQQKVEIAGREV